MRRMEERVEGLKINRNTESETRLDRLREENARLTAQITVLEERLKEADARSSRALEAERQHMQSILVSRYWFLFYLLSKTDTST
ncbi:unnamed protein product [Schistosoma curassoni]|uniref:BZIP domain-containing protein n=1 Tax=Schistosoma curassoni TaxID=6186 RepID=A0A183JSB3_9TREM|nr:unnamed protein product [Schistosoma curassoni]